MTNSGLKKVFKYGFFTFRASHFVQGLIMLLYKAHRVVVDMSVIEGNFRWVLEKTKCIHFFEKGYSKTMQHFTALSGARKGAGQYCSSSICNF